MRSELIGTDTLLSGANPVEFDNIAIDMAVFQFFCWDAVSHPSLKYAKLVLVKIQKLFHDFVSCQG